MSYELIVRLYGREIVVSNGRVWRVNRSVENFYVPGRDSNKQALFTKSHSFNRCKNDVVVVF